MCRLVRGAAFIWMTSFEWSYRNVGERAGRGFRLRPARRRDSSERAVAWIRSVDPDTAADGDVDVGDDELQRCGRAFVPTDVHEAVAGIDVDRAGGIRLAR